MADRVFSTTDRVNWADIDAFGHVNNLAYLRYFQSARIAFCQAVGIAVQPDEPAPSFIVASTQCQYFKPLHFPNELMIETQVVELGSTSLHLRHELKDEQTNHCATGADVLVLFDYQSREKINISRELRSILERWM